MSGDILGCIYRTSEYSRAVNNGILRCNKGRTSSHLRELISSSQKHETGENLTNLPCTTKLAIGSIISTSSYCVARRTCSRWTRSNAGGDVPLIGGLCAGVTQLLKTASSGATRGAVDQAR